MLFSGDRERQVTEAISRLAFANPFLPERIRWEREALGEAFQPAEPVWHPGAGLEQENPNVTRLAEVSLARAEELRRRLAEPGAQASAEELGLYQDLVLYALYNRYRLPFYRVITAERGSRRRAGFTFYDEFTADLERFFGFPAAAPLRRHIELDPPHLFACFFQLRRAFHFTFRHILGGSMPAARLRAEVWQSIFTHDLARYLSTLYRSMGTMTTLVTGPSGTGKELVARAVGFARYLPFSPGPRSFEVDFEDIFFPLNLSALSPTLVESELFGHRRGSFTGAVADRSGWFEVCPPVGTVFLDEIGEVDAAIQVKLLRVIESGAFQRLGETRERRFQGKVMAATNRDLAVEVAEGRFREDLYYRLCSDQVTTPSLAERLADRPDELADLVVFLLQGIVGPEEAVETAPEITGWIERHLGPTYRWPGNVRELGQCIRNVLIRRDYRPAMGHAPQDPRRRLAEEVAAGRLAADQLLDRYVTLVYADAGSFQEAGRRLGLDRRTVKGRLDRAFLAELAPARDPGGRG